TAHGRFIAAARPGAGAARVALGPIEFPVEWGGVAERASGQVRFVPFQGGLERQVVPTASVTLCSAQALTAAAECSVVRPSGFSVKTCLPARAAATICSVCMECGVAKTTASIDGSASTASKLACTGRPCRRLKSSARAGVRVAPATNWISSLFPCTLLTRFWPQLPRPMMAARTVADWPAWMAELSLSFISPLQMRLIMPGGIAEGSYPAGFQLQSWEASDKNEQGRSPTRRTARE